jgi:hypothetical protein
MIVALYIIGSAFAILVLAGKLRDARRQLQRVTWQRDAYAAAIQGSPPAPPPPARSDPATTPLNGRVLPPAAMTVSYSDRRPGE